MINTRFDIESLNSDQRSSLFGEYQKNIKDIETWFNVKCSQQNSVISIQGEEQNIESAGFCLNRFIEQVSKGTLDDRKVAEILMMTKNGQSPDNLNHIVKLRKTKIAPKSQHQNEYLDAIQRYDINFGVGPAGTGKTYLAVAKAVEALEQEQVSRLVLTRPAVEAGEKLGFLPGDLAQKVDPYLRPVYDALYEMLGFDKVEKLIARHVIEVAPLAYMRGRTLNHAFVILDEAQNTTPQQMKMFLTRVGFGSRAVITGDVTQTDLPGHQKSGLKQVLSILDGVDGVGFSYFSAQDVVRHPLVQNIVRAYEAYEEKLNKN
ncbi:MAG: PhoH family protein [Gammaproteobacteria bacterium]|nr:PhoH family protein [Gammaproteobacteria bacterium]